MARVICVDFDGVVHSYEKGWQDGQIYGQVTAGFFDWLSAVLTAGFVVTIYSSRSKTEGGVEAMQSWLRVQAKGSERKLVEMLEFASEKPPAWITIDDRCIRFEGSWLADELQPYRLMHFRPWNVPR